MNTVMMNTTKPSDVTVILPKREILDRQKRIPRLLRADRT